MNIDTDSSQAHSNKNKLHIHRDNEIRKNIQIMSNGWAFLGKGDGEGSIAYERKRIPLIKPTHPPLFLAPMATPDAPG
jgi:hypothetical protein